MTNGGLGFQGGGNSKKVKSLSYNQPGCPSDPPAPPSGSSSQCTSTAPGWGDATDSNNSCVRDLLDISGLTPFPHGWSIPPPTVPTPVATAWNASTDYPTRCHSLGSSPNVTFSTSGTRRGFIATRCDGTLTVSSDLGAGDGYAFFTTPGGAISLGSNDVYKFYWPSACGARPTTRPASFTCFGRTIPGTTRRRSSTRAAPAAPAVQPARSASWGGTTPSWATSSPRRHQTAASQSQVSFFGWQRLHPDLVVEDCRELGSYTGTGENVGGHQATGTAHCSFPPGTVFPSGTGADDYVGTTPPCTIPGSPAVSGNLVSGSTAHCVFPPGTVFPPTRAPMTTSAPLLVHDPARPTRSGHGHDDRDQHGLRH